MHLGVELILDKRGVDLRGQDIDRIRKAEMSSLERAKTCAVVTMQGLTGKTDSATF